MHVMATYMFPYYIQTVMGLKACATTAWLQKIMKKFLKHENFAGRWWRMLLIPALGRQRQADLCEFETCLVYRASSRTGSKATEKPCLEKQKKKQTKKKNT